MPHLASRVEVGDIFLRSGVPAVVLQAAVIVGPGSASYEMLRHLTRRLPVMLTPKWLDNRIQPIAVSDVLHYLAAAVDLPEDTNRTFDVGGPDVLTYREMIQRFAAGDRARPPGRRDRAGAHARPRRASGSAWSRRSPPAWPGRWSASLVHEVVCREHDLDEPGRPAARRCARVRRVDRRDASRGDDP